MRREKEITGMARLEGKGVVRYNIGLCYTNQDFEFYLAVTKGGSLSAFLIRRIYGYGETKREQG